MTTLITAIEDLKQVDQCHCKPEPVRIELKYLAGSTCWMSSWEFRSGRKVISQPLPHFIWHKAPTGFVRGEAACQIIRKKILVKVGLFGNRLRWITVMAAWHNCFVAHTSTLITYTLLLLLLLLLFLLLLLLLLLLLALQDLPPTPPRKDLKPKRKRFTRGLALILIVSARPVPGLSLARIAQALIASCERRNTCAEAPIMRTF